MDPITSAIVAALAKYKVHIENSQVGVVGDNAHVEGGMHFGKK